MPNQTYRRTKRVAGKGLEKFLGELQLAVMEIVWKRQPVSVGDVLTELNQQKRDLAYTTVMTIMSRLVEKGWLISEKHGRAYVYRAVHSREQAEAEAVGEVVRALLEDFGQIAVAQFVKELDGIDPEQLARLQELTQEVEQDDAEES
ncbi:MAG: BlaI/MecI/CopY family transcriptional regulator [Anaerolineae bacterium]|nr:BlaI/MecI/CopY family transcriptional regulator [Anaerolineae bacterium]